MVFSLVQAPGGTETKCSEQGPHSRVHQACQTSLLRQSPQIAVGIGRQMPTARYTGTCLVHLRLEAIASYELVRMFNYDGLPSESVRYTPHVGPWCTLSGAPYCSLLHLSVSRQVSLTTHLTSADGAELARLQGVQMARVWSRNGAGSAMPLRAPRISRTSGTCGSHTWCDVLCRQSAVQAVSQAPADNSPYHATAAEP